MPGTWKCKSQQTRRDARGKSVSQKAVSFQRSALSLMLLAALALVPGCMPDAVKMFEVQAKQQNALVTSVADKVKWENVAAVIASQVDDPEVTIEVMYAQGVQIRISARGVSSSVSLNAMGAGTGPNDAETARQINAILNSTLPPSVKEQLLADVLKQLLQPPENKTTTEHTEGTE